MTGRETGGQYLLLSCWTPGGLPVMPEAGSRASLRAAEKKPEATRVLHGGPESSRAPRPPGRGSNAPVAASPRLSQGS